jgi:hypothetical protein
MLCSDLLERPPVPQQDFVQFVADMVVDAIQNVSQIDLRIKTRDLAVSMMVMALASVSPPASLR